jgi:hypothetical protein
VCPGSDHVHTCDALCTSEDDEEDVEPLCCCCGAVLSSWKIWPFTMRTMAPKSDRRTGGPSAALDDPFFTGLT